MKRKRRKAGRQRKIGVEKKKRGKRVKTLEMVKSSTVTT